jgi:agmatine deiminase
MVPTKGIAMNRRDMLASGGAVTLMSLIPKHAGAAPPQGYRIPAEEDRHSGTLMQWPTHRAVYPDPYFLRMTQQTIADVANAIAAFEPVTMLAAKDQHAKARRKLSQNVMLWDIPTEDLWCRDAGPIFALGPDGKLAVARIQFNGWGNRQVHKNDSKIAALVARRMGLELVETGLTGEGGGVDQDGHGLLMAHESSWVNENRNPGLTRDQIETRLLAAFGARQMIWSGGVWGQDITDYHIDSLARFTGAGRVLINLPISPDPHDPFHVAALATHKTLLAAGLDVTVIPEPVKRRVDDIEFVASYANYYVCNGAVIAAEFGDKDTDAQATRALAKHYPGRDVITLNVDPLGELGGGIHCATQQIPAV